MKVAISLIAVLLIALLSASLRLSDLKAQNLVLKEDLSAMQDKHRRAAQAEANALEARDEALDKLRVLEHRSKTYVPANPTLPEVDCLNLRPPTDFLEWLYQDGANLPHPRGSN